MTCPYLGSRGDPATHHNYPTDENACYAARSRGRIGAQKIGAEHQQRYCLADTFSACSLYRAAEGPASQPASSEVPLTAEALYEQGMTHYRRREWIEARECFRRLKLLEPNRKAIDDLLDDLNLFIQLQSMRAPAESAEANAPAEPIALTSRDAGQKPARRKPRPAVWIGVSLLVVIVAVAAVFAGGVLPLPAASGQRLRTCTIVVKRVWPSATTKEPSPHSRNSCSAIPTIVRRKPAWNAPSGCAPSHNSTPKRSAISPPRNGMPHQKNSKPSWS